MVYKHLRVIPYACRFRFAHSLASVRRILMLLHGPMQDLEVYSVQ